MRFAVASSNRTTNRSEIRIIFAVKAAAGRQMHVDVRIMAFAGRRPADGDEDAIRVGPILKHMAVTVALWKGGAIAGAHRMFALVIDQYRFTRQHHDEFVLALMPMTVRRPGAGFQRDVADAEIGQSRWRRKAAIQPPFDRPRIFGRISGRIGLRDCVERQLGQCILR
ncbi:hypothetical protein SPHINGOAX6_70256 [Sphingomonas sp. AX6]|nr:hypothetical protein SPHINGOAX6_70256 [Sphingomonas sp. AX6]